MISTTVRRFVHDHIASLEELELLTLLMQDPDRWWDAAAAAKVVGIDTEWARRVLDRFAALNLLGIRVTGAVRYQYQPGRPDLEAAGAAFADAYRMNRLDVLKLVTRQSQRSVTEFADAFRIRRDDDR